MNFRKLIAGLMRIYHHIPLTADNVTVFPSRAAAIENSLRLFSPRLAIVDEHLTRHLPKQWLTSLAIEQPIDNGEVLTVIEAPRQSDLMIELIKKLKPQVVITGMADFEAITSAAFESLLSITSEIGSRLFLDISDHLELSSLPASNGVLKYLSAKTLPSHASILCGLVKNQVYSDLEVAFVISEEETIYKAFSKTVELLEGHTALISQFYYGCLFRELLAFQIADRHPLAQREPAALNPPEMIGFASSAISALNDAELSISGSTESSVVHMDTDQSFLPIPSAVKASIFESFARQNIIEAETDVRAAIQQLMKNCYGFPSDGSSEFIYGNSRLALFNKLILCCIQERGTLCFPSGTNGNYISSAKFMKANTAIIPTEAKSGFKIVPEELTRSLEAVKRPWLYISGPTINPTGLLYSNDEILEILSVCAKLGARVVIDTSFSGLEFATEGWGGWDLQDSLSKCKSPSSSFCVSLLGGLSFELMTGSIEFGFLVLNEPFLVDVFHMFPSLSKPHNTVRYAIKKLLGLREQKNQELSDAILQQKSILKTRAECLTETLNNCGWDAIGCCGGISLVAKPTAFVGKILKTDGLEIKLDDTNFRDALLRATGLCINSASWTKIPSYCRFTIALEEAEFERALECIKQFKKLVLGD